MNDKKKEMRQEIIDMVKTSIKILILAIILIIINTYVIYFAQLTLLQSVNNSEYIFFTVFLTVLGGMNFYSCGLAFGRLFHELKHGSTAYNSNKEIFDYCPKCNDFCNKYPSS